MTILDLVVLGLAVWRLSSLLAHEEGPWAMFSRFRYWAGERPEYNIDQRGVRQDNCVTHFCKGLICVACNSMWVGMLFVTLYYFVPIVILWLSLPLALSTLAVLAESLIAD